MAIVFTKAKQAQKDKYHVFSLISKAPLQKDEGKSGQQRLGSSE